MEKNTKEEEKLNRLMKILENMNINSNGPNISKEELIKLREDQLNKKEKINGKNFLNKK